jgi:hypothetical protein
MSLNLHLFQSRLFVVVHVFHSFLGRLGKFRNSRLTSGSGKAVTSARTRALRLKALPHEPPAVEVGGVFLGRQIPVNKPYSLPPSLPRPPISFFLFLVFLATTITLTTVASMSTVQYPTLNLSHFCINFFLTIVLYIPLCAGRDT